MLIVICHIQALYAESHYAECRSALYLLFFEKDCFCVLSKCAITNHFIFHHRKQLTFFSGKTSRRYNVKFSIETDRINFLGEKSLKADHFVHIF